MLYYSLIAISKIHFKFSVLAFAVLFYQFQIQIINIFRYLLISLFKNTFIKGQMNNLFKDVHILIDMYNNNY